jgi:hypothetical protein
MIVWFYFGVFFDSGKNQIWFCFFSIEDTFFDLDIRNWYFLRFLLSLFETPSELELNYGEPSSSPYIFEGVLGSYANFASNLLRCASDLEQAVRHRSSDAFGRIVNGRLHGRVHGQRRVMRARRGSRRIFPKNQNLPVPMLSPLPSGVATTFNEKGQREMTSHRQLCLTFPTGIFSLTPLFRALENDIFWNLIIIIKVLIICSEHIVYNILK